MEVIAQDLRGGTFVANANRKSMQNDAKYKCSR